MCCISMLLVRLAFPSGWNFRQHFFAQDASGTGIREIHGSPFNRDPALAPLRLPDDSRMSLPGISAMSVRQIHGYSQMMRQAYRTPECGFGNEHLLDKCSLLGNCQSDHVIGRS